MRSIAIVLAGLAILAAPAGDQPPAAQAARERLVARMQGLEIPQQVDALIRLAWPASPSDEEVAALARSDLLDYGDYALKALRKAILTVPESHQADVVATLIENQKRAARPLSSELALALEEAIWFANPESKRLAIRESARRRFQHAVLPIIDSAIEYPDLVEDAIESLGWIGSDRARFFIGERLREGPAPVRLSAAVALVRIGGTAREPLREAALSDDEALRTVAIQSLLSSATPEDLYVFHDFVARYGEADPPTTEAVRQIAVQLEAYLEQQEEAEAP